ncbi:MAG: phenylacetate--CoA ligase family protein, partial [Deltaproteobacteria bacterium]|nr:phenylacetate--CoA ligase family protein [Deltaproteobacteria bacterium]
MRDAAHWSPTEALPRGELDALQLRRLQALLVFLWKEKPFYRERLEAAGVRPDTLRRLDDLRAIPFTEKADLLEWEARGLGPPPEQVVRWHQTSGTTGMPIRVGDTREDWYAYGDLSAAALYGMGIRQGDTVLPAFSYGPHIAFWAYIQAVERIGAALVPAGGLTSQARVALLRDYRATVLLCTPSYSLHLHEVAAGMGLDPRR